MNSSEFQQGKRCSQRMMEADAVVPSDTVFRNTTQTQKTRIQEKEVVLQLPGYASVDELHEESV